jgi:hypothetical protein
MNPFIGDRHCVPICTILNLQDDPGFAVKLSTIFSDQEYFSIDPGYVTRQK